VLPAILAYVALQLLIGFWVSRRVRNEADYLVAGRSLGYTLTVFSVFATWFGAETCIGSSGEAYRAGLGGTTADPFGYSLCLLFMGLLFAARLWRLGLTTFADLFRMRYGAPVERLAVLIIAPTSILWAAAQIRAFGQVLGASSSLGTELGTTIAAGVVLAYTVMGGSRADAITDLIQGSVLVLGLVVLGGAAWASGDFAHLTDDPTRLSLALPDASHFDVAEAWAIPVLGSVMAPELVQRVISARSATVARRATLGAAVLYFAVGSIPVLVGLAAARSLPGLDDPEQVLLHQGQRHLHAWLYVLFAGALVSAILSTVDTALLVAGSLLAHNVVLPVVRPAGDRALAVNRACVVGCGLVAYALARSADGVYALVEEASALGSSGVVVTAAFALYGRFGGARSAIAALVTGFAVYTTGAHLGLALDHPYLASVASALCAYVAFALPRGRRAVPVATG
jgi:Na+/proline symporter